MSLKKLHLYRNKIEQAVRDFVGDNTLQIEVQSPQKIKYSVLHHSVLTFRFMTYSVRFRRVRNFILQKIQEMLTI